MRDIDGIVKWLIFIIEEEFQVKNSKSKVTRLLTSLLAKRVSGQAVTSLKFKE
ncbi:MAG: hypothetical protein PHW01_00805 [Patescibacteria group bacterium]|nr:hypothetical protein [Patescibacteria group bacterium]